MAQHSRLSVAPPPTAPVRESTGRLMMRGQITLTLFAALAHTAVFNLLGTVGAIIALCVILLATVGSAVAAVTRSGADRFPWRRLPWAALGYVVFALLSFLWSHWPQATLLTWLLQATVTVVALFAASALSWQEIVRSLATALAWIIGLSIALELWVALRGAPLLPNFADVPEGRIDPQWYWVRGNLLDGGRIQGIVGNANSLAFLCVLALIVFGVLFAGRGRGRGVLVAGMAAAAFLLLRASSITAYACAAAVAVALVMALLARWAHRPGQRARLYLGAVAGALVVGSALWIGRDALFGALGRSSDLTGRLGIWNTVAERAGERPLLGNGFSSPWVPWDPAFDGWIVDHGITVFHAHEMWLDVYLQLGAIGVALMAAVFLALTWRAWFFAVDRPRWDLRTDRPHSPLALLPLLVTTMLLVQGLVESGPIMLWGWMLVVLLSYKMKTVPLIGRGRGEIRSAAPGSTARWGP